MYSAGQSQNAVAADFNNNSYVLWDLGGSPQLHRAKKELLQKGTQLLASGFAGKYYNFNSMK